MSMDAEGPEGGETMTGTRVGRRIAGALLVATVISGAAVALPDLPAAAAPTWTVTRSPGIDGLNGVSCVSVMSCITVGDYVSNSTWRSLVESWNGTGWTVVKSPNKQAANTYLQGVSCVSAVFCVAVGSYTRAALVQTLVETWNGTTWSIVISPNSGSDDQLTGVSCISATSCEAVGSYSDSSGLKQSLFESWDGAQWTAVAAFGTRANWLNAVSCVSSTSCEAVGRYGNETAIPRSFTESWNGSKWTGHLGPNVGTGGSFLDGVSCVSPISCKAVGVYYRPNHSGQSNAGLTLVESWNGTAWSVVSTPNPRMTFYGDQLNGVSCISAVSCQAVGVWANSNSTWVTLIESWNGSRWSILSSPNRGTTYDYLNGISCPSTVSCKAVGTYSPNGTLSATLALSYG